MANAVKGEVGFKAGGAERTLCLNVNALCEIEDRLGRPAMEVFAEMQTSVRIKALRAIFACGVGVSEAEAGDMIDEIGLAAAAELLGEGVKRAFPQGEGVEENPRKAAPGGTG